MYAPLFQSSLRYLLEINSYVTSLPSNIIKQKDNKPTVRSDGN